ncbi:MAG: hypothetical protein QG623_552 [Patescibacteria group bacterium]|nr:hypothetical protein [Patescibacteria group bacterium]
MEGEYWAPDLAIPPGTSSSLNEPTRPPCAIAFRSACKEEDPDKQQVYLDAANRHALEATPEMCANCLGRPVVDIVCALPGPQHPQNERFNLSLETLRTILDELGGAATRLRKLLKEDGKLSSNNALDNIIRWAFHSKGIPQHGRIEPQEDIELPPTIETVKDPRDKAYLEEDPLSAQDGIITPPLGEVEEAILIGDTVPDPRHTVNKAKYEKEDRKPCATLLAQAFKERTTTRETWQAQNIPLEPGSRSPIDHSGSEATYRKAIGQTKTATKEDCDRCLKRENCPILNNVEFKRLSDTTNKPSKLPDGKTIKTQVVMVEITSGRPRSFFSTSELNVLDKKLKKRVEEGER